MKQYLWCNRYVTNNKKTLSWSKWKNKGICFIENIINENNEILPMEEFKNKFSIQPNFLQYYNLIHGIPKLWKQIFKMKKMIMG